MKQYPCDLSPSGTCEYGGNKYINYGFFRGTFGYCRKVKRRTSYLDECPKEQSSPKETDK